jgi:peroxiredoxin
MKWRSLEQSTQSQSRSLREIYEQRKQLTAKYVPAEVQEIHARAVSELQHSDIAERALLPGDTAPEFELPDQSGTPLRSHDLITRGPLVICFFRGRWCPFCVGQMEAMNAIYAGIEELGASLVGISPQTVHQSFLMADQHKLRFPLLSDAGNQVARQYRLVYRVPDYQQEIYRRVFINLPFVNGDDSWELPIPATYILGASKNLHHRGHGVTQREQPESAPDPVSILYANANPDYTERPEPSEILQFLAQLVS